MSLKLSAEPVKGRRKGKNRRGSIEQVSRDGAEIHKLTQSEKQSPSRQKTIDKHHVDKQPPASFPSKETCGFADKDFFKTLTSHPWYHGMMPRHEIEELLKNDGEFLMRATDVQGINRLCVSVSNSKRVRHILIKQNSNGEWYIRNIPKDKSVINLIQTHIDKKLPIQPDGTLLVKPIARPEYYILHENVDIKVKLGGGKFGDVYKAVHKQANGKCIDVAVKKLKSMQGKKGRSEFIKEAKIMRDLHHDNIVQMIGVAPQEEPMLILMEFCKGGSLDGYLKKNPDTTTEQLSGFTRDACRGMRYLSEKKIIHRDLAARNCLLGDKNQVKISDFGLAHENQEAFNVDKLKNVPIRWLSPETLNRGEFSVKTDVWSFGVLMWEIFSKCQSEPYPKLNNTQVKAKIKSGEEPMIAPNGTPSIMARAMSLCFVQDPLQRPDFQTLYLVLTPGGK
ncbi:protein tyrosine kinase domain-containing protein [Ditylenchus destructor]|uniref:Tyrosine-protein kinase n=1 Tax=Ditylenchus destructor TaxID=166010 RepID=A0AAD4NJI1_9BILA|nr:protein tyrosine kinase domain-containing protein [Ditylenchus destructor]